MRILFLQTFPLGGSGSGTYARELAREVARHHTVAMVVPDKREIEGVKMYRVSLPVKIAFTGHPEWPDCLLYTKVGPADFSENYLSYFQAVVKAVNDFKPDIIHVHHLMPLSWIARYIKAMYGIQFIVTAHGSELPTLEADKRYPVLTTEAMKKAARVVPNSFWTRQWMKKVLGNSFDHNTRVIPGGVDANNFPVSMPAERLDELNKKYRFAPDEKIIMFSGKLTKYKGVKYLVQAAKKIPATIVIVGDGPDRKALEQQVKEQNIKNVRFLGAQPNQEVIRLYYRAQVAVVPSVWDEPLGLVVLEAMAAKTPVVVTRKGGIPLMVKDEVNGLFVRPRNAQDISDKVNVLLTNETLRQKIAESARKTVLEKFTWEIIAGKYEKMYQEFKKRERVSDAGPLDSWVKSIFSLKLL
jgi:glycogen(starch) synthase